MYPEKFWHCYVSVPGRKKDRDRAVVNDMTFDQLRREVIEPFRHDVPFTLAGTIIKGRTAIEEIRVVQTPQPQSFYAERHNAEMRAAGIADLATNRSLLPFEKGVDHTNELLFRGLDAPAPPP